ncbi:Ubiquitin thioesterase Zranb1-like protein, partial [Leptotrombidium deliense]
MNNKPSEQESRGKWSCKRCTFENWPKSLNCTICFAAKHSSLIIGNEEQDIYKIAPLIVNSEASESKNSFNNKWICEMCTYLNWPKSTKCTQCLTRRKKSLSRSSSPDTSSDVRDIASESSCATSTPVSSSSSDTYHNDRNRSVSISSLSKWSCPACTYDNWPKSTKCVICFSGKPKHDKITEVQTSCEASGDERLTNTPSPPGAQGASVKRVNSNDITVYNNNRNKEFAELGASSAPHQTNNYLEEKRLRHLKKKVREADWLWLAACCAVINGDPEPVLQYLASGGDPSRQLTSSELSLLARPSAFDVGHTLVHLAIRFQ